MFVDVQLQVTVDTTSNSELEQLNILKKKTEQQRQQQKNWAKGIFFWNILPSLSQESKQIGKTK